MIEGTKPCTQCAEAIASEAIKCRHCGCYQGRWFFLNMSAPVLSLLVALVSVLSLAIPAVVKTFDYPRSDVVVSFQYFEDGNAFIVASNSGSRPGSIGEVYFDYGKTGKRFNLRGDAKSRYIAPGTSRQLTFRLPCSQDYGPQTHYAESDKWGSRPIAKDARLNIIIVQFDGRSETTSIAIGDLSGIQAINDRLVECTVASLRGDKPE